MALHPDLRPFLGGPDTANLDDIAGSRARYHALTADVRHRRHTPEGLTVEEHTIPGPDGGDLALRLYRRTDLPRPSGALVFAHGGAFVFGDLELEHDRCLAYAERASVVVVAVDYRLAPEFVFPAGQHDLGAALTWVLANADVLGVDPQRVGLGGASAGGALAAGLALDRRGSASLRALLLLYPVVSDETDSPSHQDFYRYEPWDGARSEQMWPLYLGHDGAAPPEAAPGRVADLRSLPETFVLTCEEDPLRDQDLDFARRLLDAGVSVELHHYRGTYHAFDVIAPTTALAQAALDEQARFLHDTLGRAPGRA